MLKSTWIALPLLALPGCAPGPGATRVARYLAAYEAAALSSGVVLAARGDSILFVEPFGYADFDGRVRNTVDTRFRVGSITKSMTWAAIQLLAERGMLDLDEPVAEVIHTPALAPAVTSRNLLTHEGGVADWSRYPDAPAVSARASSTEELAAWIASQPLIFAPGTDRSYSNSGYILLARVIEAASGRSYGDFLRAELFSPLGMAATRSVTEPADLTRGYTQGHSPALVVAAEQVDPSILVGSGSVVTTAGDLFAWSRSAAAQSFPWDERERHGRRVRYMGGFVPGFGAWLERYADEDITVLVMTNLNNGAIQKIVSDLGALVLGEPYEAPAPLEDREVRSGQRDTFSGYWVCDGGTEFTIRPEGRRLDLLWRHAPPRQPVWLQTDSTLFYPQDWAVIRARRTEGSRTLSYETWGGGSAECRLATPAPDPARRSER